MKRVAQGGVGLVLIGILTIGPVPLRAALRAQSRAAESAAPHALPHCEQPDHCCCCCTPEEPCTSAPTSGVPSDQSRQHNREHPEKPNAPGPGCPVGCPWCLPGPVFVAPAAPHDLAFSAGPFETIPDQAFRVLTIPGEGPFHPPRG
jgi:hypothetical protein